MKNLNSVANSSLIAYLREHGGKNVMVNCKELSLRNNLCFSRIYAAAISLAEDGLVTIQKMAREIHP